MTSYLAWLPQAIERQRLGLRDNPRLVAWLASVDALYLYGSIGIDAVLRLDGTVWVDRCDSWPESDVSTWRLGTQEERIGSLLIAKHRLPEVAALLPARPSSAFDCPTCSGGGYLHASPTNRGLLCPYCWGLGWQDPTGFHQGREQSMDYPREVP
jgi:hypothetical protein